MLEQFLDNLMNPPKEFTPIPFWFLNDEPDAETIEWQLADYVEKGVNGIIIHPRIGLPEEMSYLSQAYFETVKHVVETANRLGMKVVLYDEGMYPSGSAHGLVAAENADYASKGIVLSDKADRGQVITRFADGKYLIYDFTHGTIRGIHYGEDDGEAGAPKSADILNPKAVDAFIRLTHERYYQELGEYFGSTIIAFFTDEPCPLGRNAGVFREWVPGMEQEIIAEGGRLEELETLFGEGENDTTRLYHDLIKRHLREIYYARLSGWCESHGISLMGHPEESDDVEEEFYFHIPGQDLIMRRVAPESGGIREPDSVQAKLPADIARYLGRRRNANECFGVCSRGNIPWYFTGYDMKWYINWLGIRGVNLFVPHAFYYSVAGPRKEERPPDVGPNNIWWPHYHLFSNYMKRISYLMTDAMSLAKVAVLCDDNRVPTEEVAGLYEHQIDFHYLPVALLEDCAVKEGLLCLGTCQFEVVVDLYGYRRMEMYKRHLTGIRVTDGVDTLYSQTVYRTVVTADEYPYLRAIHMVKEGIPWYLFANEGEEMMETKIHIKKEDDRKWFWIRLWDGCVEECAENELKLDSCEMKLLLLLNEKEECAMRRNCPESRFVRTGEQIFLGDWTECFVPWGEESLNTAVYRYTYILPEGRAPAGTEYFSVRGEEMAECTCNGAFAGVSFFGPHKFQIGSLLKKGENEICLRFTGNAANLYGTEKIPFGLE